MQPSGDSGATATYLEDLTASLLMKIKNQEWSDDDLQRYIGDNYSVYAPAAFLEQLSHPLTSTRQAYLDSYKAFMEANPDYDFEIVTVDADVDDREDKAQIWVVLSIVGHPPATRKESVSVIYWVRTEDNWRAVKQIGIRGVQIF